MRKLIFMVLVVGIGLIDTIGLADQEPRQSGNSRVVWIGNPHVNGRQLSTREVSPKATHLKMDSALCRFRDAYLSTGLAAAMEAPVRGSMDLDGDNVLVVSELRTQGTTQASQDQAAKIIEARIADLSGKVELRNAHLIQHWIPVAELNHLADMPEIRYVRLPQKPQLETITEGVHVTGADQWQQMQEYRTSGNVTICVLDGGFKGYQALKGSALPASVETRSFRADGNIEAGEDHGTACAEIVHAMAPDANIVLCNYNTDVELRSAVDWIIARKFNVVSHSIGYFNNGPGNGTGPIDEAVKKVSENGIAWINSAGNYAQQHWAGTFNDPDGDGYHNFSGTDEMLTFELPAYVVGSVDLKWDDWGSWNGVTFSGSNQDYDLQVWYWTGTSFQIYDRSENHQTGTQLPTEAVSGMYSKNSITMGISIRKYKATRNVYFDCFIRGGENLDHLVPAGSLNAPADSPYAIAVGATDWETDAYHYYSSQGPTLDGRVKPDLSAPSRVSTTTYGTADFLGTSAAAPHVAGAVALLLGKTPYTPHQVMQIIQSRALDLGVTGKDNQFGFGSLRLTK